jgi:uncharacterized membrane protein
MFASTYVTIDPTWPWDIPYLGVPILLAAAAVLTGLTLWTYLGVANISFGRLLSILSLRLAALLVAFILVLRPSLAEQNEDSFLPGKLLILVDGSTSMNIEDEVPTSTRWDKACAILRAAAVAEALKKLAQDNKIEAVYYQGAAGIAPFDPNGGANGKRTDFGAWLSELWQLHGREGVLGLLIFSDGANNFSKRGKDGRPLNALQLAKNGWGGLHTFALGKPNTPLKQRDIALTGITPPAEALPVKTQFTVKGIIDAWGFKDSPVDVSLWIEDPASGEMKQAGRKDRVMLKKESGNEISLTRDVPGKAGEYKIALKVDPLPGEATKENNQIESFITVTKEGVSILWVEGRKRLESTFILRHALAKERRFRLYSAEKLAEKPASESDWFDFDKQHYDVIVICDVSAQRFASGNRDIFGKIKQLVARGTGLMFFGGHEAFGNSGWGDVPELQGLLPVRMDVRGQVEGPVRMTPTAEGLRHYLLNLADDPAKNREIWEKTFDPLDGMTPTGAQDPMATILATRDGNENEPVLVTRFVGDGRVLVFAGDTTWKSWRRSKEMLSAYERFWRQTMLWLARQENLEGSAWIKLDARRLSVGTDTRLGFNVGLKGKGGIDIANAEFKVKIYGPNPKDEAGLTTRTEKDGERGYFDKIVLPGEYRIEVVAKGKDPNETVDGKPKEVSGTASARFLIVSEELEDRPPASDHEFMRKLAKAGGGQFYFADETKLLELLAELKGQKQNQPHVEIWPDWRRNPGHSASATDQLRTLWQTTALPCLILFVSFLSLEWYLRRRWELV